MNRYNLKPLIVLFLTSMTIFAEQEVDTIIITAELSEEIIDNHPKTTITEDEINSFPGATTPELISNVMGVKLSKFGNDTQPSFISIRGSSPEQVLVLINGKKLNSAQGGGVDLSIIPPESIKEIEIIRGGDSAVYGGSAFGGIINIITKDVTSSYTTIKYDYDTDNINDLSINLYKDLNTLKISSNVNAIYSNGSYNFTDVSLGTEVDNSDIKSLSTSISLENDFDNIIVDLFGNFYISEKGVPGTTEFPTDTARMSDIQFSGNLGFEFDLLEWDIDCLFKNRNYIDPNGILGAIDSTHDYRSISSLLSYSNNFTNIELNGTYDYLESTTYEKDFVDKKNISLYISPIISIEELNITPSVRIDYNLEEAFLFSWSLGMAYKLFDDQLEITLSGGSAYREPSFNDLFWPETSFATGNINLENEKALISDLDLLYKITDSLTVQTTLYYHYITNLIQWNPGPSGIWSPKNIGLAKIMGIESELTYLIDFLPISGYLEGRLNYTYLSSLNKEPGVLYNKQLINRTSHKGNFILIYYSDFDFILSVDLSYTGSRFITSANTKLAPEYVLLDMNFSKEILDNTTLNIYGKNILNIEYEDYRGYPVPGMTLGLSVEYRIDKNE